MNDASTTEPGTTEVAPISRHRLLIERALLLCLITSALLHSMVVAIAYTVKVPEVSIDIDVQESAGVALMAQIGWAEPSDDEETEEFVESELTREEMEALAEEMTEFETPEPTEPVERAEPAEPVEPEAEPVEPVEPDGGEDGPEEEPTEDGTEPPRRVGDRLRPPREEPSEPAVPRAPVEPVEPAEAAEPVEEEPPDPASLPPRQRFPEGTVNPVATDVGMWGPEGAASVAVIRNDRIRRSPYRDQVEAIFGGLGDTQHLTEDTAIDLIDDVDTMLLASTDISNSRRTFIAAVHHLDPGYLMSELRRGFPSGVRWEERSDGRYFGTPGAETTFQRRFLVPMDRLLIYAQPDLMDDLLRRAPRARGLADEADSIDEVLRPPPTVDEILVELGLEGERPEEYDAPGCADRRGVGRTRCRERQRDRTRETNAAIAAWNAQREELLPQAEERREEALDEWREARTNGRRNRADDEPPIRDDAAWMRGLLEVGDLAGTGRSGPAVLWTFSGFRTFRVDGMRSNTAAPQQLVASLSVGRDPKFEGRFVFENREEAEDFSSQWSSVVEHYTFALMAAGLHGAFAAGEWEIDHNEAILRVDVPGSALGRIAALTALGG